MKKRSKRTVFMGRVVIFAIAFGAALAALVAVDALVLKAFGLSFFYGG
ncbi:MAG: hypothetical protein OEV59_05885 [Deltaproteobacteria bacterium]|nr:hypothetical protein [Deltaproteobacteria bacterium]